MLAIHQTPQPHYLQHHNVDAAEIGLPAVRSAGAGRTSCCQSGSGCHLASGGCLQHAVDGIPVMQEQT